MTKTQRRRILHELVIQRAMRRAVGGSRHSQPRGNRGVVKRRINRLGDGVAAVVRAPKEAQLS